MINILMKKNKDITLVIFTLNYFLILNKAFVDFNIDYFKCLKRFFLI